MAAVRLTEDEAVGGYGEGRDARRGRGSRAAYASTSDTKSIVLI